MASRPKPGRSQKYGPVFVEAEQLASKINKILPPGATFYEWGNETGFCFNMRREPPSGLIFSYPVQAGPLAPKLSSRLLKDLGQNEPEIVVESNETLRLTTGPRNFAMVRKGGELDGGEPIAVHLRLISANLRPQ
jgi:hypothetical protein